MASAILKPEVIDLFREYEVSHREVFLDESLRFIRGYGCTRQELAVIRKATVERGKLLRLPKNGRQGRPSRQQESSASGAFEPGLGDPGDSDTSDDAFSRDWSRHGGFRTVCMVLGDIPTNRRLFLEQIRGFIDGADKRELAKVRRTVAHRGKDKRPKRGRPDVWHNEKIMTNARRAAWMRHIEGKKQREIGEALGIQDSSPGWKATTVRRLEDYLAVAIWRAIPDTYIRVSASGREIAPGALDNKYLQTYIGFQTGLPFRSHPEECKCIVEALWPRGNKADWELIERRLSYRRTRRGV